MAQRILLVTDDPEIVRILRRGLALEGYALLVDESGEEAPEMLESLGRPQLIHNMRDVGSVLREA